MKTDLNDPELDKAYAIYAEAMDRKMRLLDLFEDWERAEESRRKGRPKAKRKYDRMINGLGEVARVDRETIRWRRAGGELIAPVLMTEDICKNLRKGDQLMMVLGLRGRAWRVIFVRAVINETGESYLEKVPCGPN